MSFTVKKSTPSFRLIVADDDAEDIQLIRESLEENDLQASIKEVENGELLLNELRGTKMPDRGLNPHLILLDLNMPRKSGFDVLKELKEDKNLRSIPIVIFSTSTSEKDVKKAYELGANCFICKPNNLEGWHATIGKLGRFWIECATHLP
jgi:CheY-like chemotaxis protein